MKKLTSAEGLLIVVELGAEWPASEVDATRSAKARRVLSQDEAEAPAAFAARVSQQLTGSFASGAAVGSVLVACNERIDAHAQSARVELARAAGNALSRSGGGTLSFVACDRNDARSKPVFSALLAEVTRQWQSSGVEVKLNFGESSLALAAADPKSSPRTSAPVKDSVRRVA